MNIVLDGSGSPSRSSGLNFMSDVNTVQGIQVQGFESGAIAFNGSDNMIAGNILGGATLEKGNGAGVAR